MVDDEFDDEVQSAAGVVVDALPEWFKSRMTCSAGAGGGDVLAVVRTVASVDFPPQQCPL